MAVISETVAWMMSADLRTYDRIQCDVSAKALNVVTGPAAGEKTF